MKVYKLSSLTKVPDSVEIGDKTYPILTMESLSPLDQAKGAFYFKKLAKIEDLDNLSLEVLEEASEAFDAFLLLVLEGITPEVLATLNNAKRWELFGFFLEVSKEKQGQKKKLPPPTQITPIG